MIENGMPLFGGYRVWIREIFRSCQLPGLLDGGLAECARLFPYSLRPLDLANSTQRLGGVGPRRHDVGYPRA
ncbi:MAG TPA: hypothetical protein VFD42_05465, partial [Chloroflexota bacterium]|nr:hypothetical protein [Chloroflexota bacterium]